MKMLLPVSAFLSVALAGCAYTTFVPVSPQDTVTTGQRVYDSKPILVVTPSTAQIQFIPNYSRAYAVQFGAFLAKNDFSIKVENGIVTSLDSKLDSTAVVELLKAIAEKALTPPALGKTTAGDPVTGPGIAIFDFVFDDQGNIVELRPIKLSLPRSLLRATPVTPGKPVTPMPAPAPTTPGQAPPGKTTPGRV